MLASGTAAAVTHTRGGGGVGWGGVGWDVNVHVNLRQQLMLRTRGVGWGVGWDVNVHVNLRQDVNVHVNGTSFTNLIQVCAVPEAGTRMMMMMMMMMVMMMM